MKGRKSILEQMQEAFRTKTAETTLKKFVVQCKNCTSMQEIQKVLSDSGITASSIPLRNILNRLNEENILNAKWELYAVANAKRGRKLGSTFPGQGAGIKHAPTVVERMVVHFGTHTENQALKKAVEVITAAGCSTVSQAVEALAKDGFSVSGQHLSKTLKAGLTAPRVIAKDHPIRSIRAFAQA